MKGVQFNQKYFFGLDEATETTQPIEGVMDAPNLPLQQAIKADPGLNSLDLEANVFAAITFASKKLNALNSSGCSSPLTLDEIAVIHLYSQECGFYRELNTRLRSPGRFKLCTLFPLLKILLTALKKLPRDGQRKTVYRGIKLRDKKTYDEVRQRYSTGDMSECFFSWDLSSSTSNPQTLQNDMFLGRDGYRVMFAMELWSLASIKEYSSLPNEEEYLCFPGTMLRRKGGLLEPAHGLTIISLEQVNCPVMIKGFDLSYAPAQQPQRQVALSNTAPNTVQLDALTILHRLSLCRTPPALYSLLRTLETMPIAGATVGEAITRFIRPDLTWESRIDAKSALFGAVGDAFVRFLLPLLQSSTTADSVRWLAHAVNNLAATPGNESLFATAAVRDALVAMAPHATSADGVRWLANAIKNIISDANNKVLFSTTTVRDALVVLAANATNADSVQAVAGTLCVLSSHAMFCTAAVWCAMVSMAPNATTAESVQEVAQALYQISAKVDNPEAQVGTAGVCCALLATANSMRGQANKRNNRRRRNKRRRQEEYVEEEYHSEGCGCVECYYRREEACCPPEGEYCQCSSDSDNYY